MTRHDIVVVGGSAGGLDGIIELARGLPADLPASIFVVIHMSSSSPNYLGGILNRAGPLPAATVEHGEEFRPGRIYVARADYHLVLDSRRARAVHGPKENRFRPAIDPLFRSAALGYGPRVIGVVLSGGLDDGTAGLWAIKTRGGLAIVQDPDEADVPSMPESALRQTRVDYCLRLADMAPILTRLVTTPAAPDVFPVPDGLETETKIAMQEKALEAGLRELGEPSMFACPECHGVLLRLLQSGGGLRFRCHTGHAYTAAALLAELTDGVEVALWSAIRSVEESALLMEHIADHVRLSGDAATASLYARKAGEARARAESVRETVFRHEVISPEKLGTKPGGAA
jgi:two-component system chemotaxis response regulator CheB